jgi:hypothetical protein
MVGVSELYGYIVSGAVTDIDKVFCLVLFFMILEMVFKLIAELFKLGKDI